MDGYGNSLLKIKQEIEKNITWERKIIFGKGEVHRYGNYSKNNAVNYVRNAG